MAPITNGDASQALLRALRDAQSRHPSAAGKPATADASTSTPPAADSPAIRLASTLLAHLLINATAAHSVAVLSRRLADLGVPVPALTYAQAWKLWTPAAAIVSTLAYRARPQRASRG